MLTYIEITTLRGPFTYLNYKPHWLDGNNNFNKNVNEDIQGEQDM